MFGLSWQTIIGAALLLGMAFSVGEYPVRADSSQGLRIACAGASAVCDTRAR